MSIQPFRRISIDYMVIGVTRVVWELAEGFQTAPFMKFQLQVNRNADEPDQWVNVGPQVVNQLWAADTEQRQFGKRLRLNYRVILTMPDGAIYTSDLARILGNLTEHQWILARAIARRGPMIAKSMHSFEGWLLKRRTEGAYCTCVDPITKGILNSNHELCGGTGRLQGYWNASVLTMFDLTPEVENTRNRQTGTLNDAQVMGRCVAIPMPSRRDVWVDAHSGKRYYIDIVQPEHEINRVPILVGLKLQLAEFSDVVYKVPLGLSDDQIERVRKGEAGAEAWRKNI